MRLCVCPPGVKFLFLSVSSLEVLWSNPSGLQSRFPGDSSSPCWTPRLANLTCGSQLSLLWYNLCGIIVLQFVGRPAGRYDLILLWLHPSYHLTVASSFSVVVGNLFWQVPAFFANGCSAVSCDFWCSYKKGVSSYPSSPPYSKSLTILLYWLVPFPNIEVPQSSVLCSSFSICSGR